jgi:hypothetical protein
MVVHLPQLNTFTKLFSGGAQMTSKKRTWTISLRNKSNFFIVTLIDKDLIEGEVRAGMQAENVEI